jgi:hypothetical protein
MRSVVFRRFRGFRFRENWLLHVANAVLALLPEKPDPCVHESFGFINLLLGEDSGLKRSDDLVQCHDHFIPYFVECGAT